MNDQQEKQSAKRRRSDASPRDRQAEEGIQAAVPAVGSSDASLQRQNQQHAAEIASLSSEIAELRQLLAQALLLPKPSVSGREEDETDGKPHAVDKNEDPCSETDADQLFSGNQRRASDPDLPDYYRLPVNSVARPHAPCFPGPQFRSSTRPYQAYVGDRHCPCCFSHAKQMDEFKRRIFRLETNINTVWHHLVGVCRVAGIPTPHDDELRSLGIRPPPICHIPVSVPVVPLDGRIQRLDDRVDSCKAHMRSMDYSFSQALELIRSMLSIYHSRDPMLRLLQDVLDRPHLVSAVGGASLTYFNQYVMTSPLADTWTQAVDQYAELLRAQPRPPGSVRLLTDFVLAPKDEVPFLPSGQLPVELRPPRNSLHYSFGEDDGAPADDENSSDRSASGDEDRSVQPTFDHNPQAEA